MKVIKRKIVFFIVILCQCYTLLPAQQLVFSSRKLEEIGKHIPDHYYPSIANTINVPSISSRPIIVDYNKKKEVSHIGISLFSQEMKELINLPVCNFLERVLLELILCESGSDQERKLKEYDIRLENQNGKKIAVSTTLAGINTSIKFSLDKEQGKYVAKWEDNKYQSTLISFPASRELIFGTDKKESDEELGGVFAGDNCTGNMPQVTLDYAALALKKQDGTDLYVHTGNIFMINAMNSNTYYQRHDKTYQVVFDKFYPYESLSNLFLTQGNKHELKLQITHRIYGANTPVFDISLDNFVCLFKDDFDIFCGTLDGRDLTKIKMTVILRNKNYDFVHMLEIDTSKEILFTRKGILKADLYTNIPQQNIEYLFEEDKSIK